MRECLYWIEEGKEQMIRILFPRRCPVCGEIVVPAGRLACPDCQKKLSYVTGPACMKCGKELVQKEGEYCRDCMKRRRTFRQGAALLNYNEVSARSMAQIKYHNRREYLDFYSEEMVRKLGGKIRRMEADALIPVPVHPSRKRTRGYNQAEELAARLSKRLGIPMCSDVLARSKKTAPQKELTPEQRLKNLEQAFEVREENLWQDMDRVILVDDIYTTGSTIEACSRALKKAGIGTVYFLSVCIGGDR